MAVNTKSKYVITRNWDKQNLNLAVKTKTKLLTKQIIKIQREHNNNNNNNNNNNFISRG